MRCILCDFSSETPSLFCSGLHDEREDARKFSQTEAGEFICSYCEEASEGLWDPDLDEEEYVEEDDGS
jgi:hypothetical protein